VAANFFSAGGANSVLPDPLAGFRGHFTRGKERGIRNERIGKERYGTKHPKIPPPLKKINIWLWP